MLQTTDRQTTDRLTDDSIERERDFTIAKNRNTRKTQNDISYELVIVHGLMSCVV